MRHDPTRPLPLRVFCSFGTTCDPLKSNPSGKDPAAPDWLLLNFGVLTLLLSGGATWAMFLSGGRYFLWSWMAAASGTCLFMVRAGWRPGKSLSIPRGVARKPLHVDQGGLSFVFSGALWPILLRSLSEMGPNIGLLPAAVAGSISLFLGVVVACGTLSRSVRLGAGVHSILVAWGLVSIGGGRVPSIPEAIFSGALLVICVVSELGPRHPALMHRTHMTTTDLKRRATALAELH